jgi:hypothetical protein
MPEIRVCFVIASSFSIVIMDYSNEALIMSFIPCLDQQTRSLICC